jgi:hypothetical protein
METTFDLVMITSAICVAAYIAISLGCLTIINSGLRAIRFIA